MGNARALGDTTESLVDLTKVPNNPGFYLTIDRRIIVGHLKNPPGPGARWYAIFKGGNEYVAQANRLGLLKENLTRYLADEQAGCVRSPCWYRSW